MERKRSSRRGRYRPRGKSTWQKCKDCFRQFIAFMFSNVGIIGLVIGYTIMGAFTFIAIESKESETRSITGMRKDVLTRLWNITYHINVFNEERYRELVSVEIKTYQEQVVEAIGDGYDGSTDIIKMGTTWSFPGAFLYSLTVITTIGYGNITPNTQWGKIATIFYAIAGMPLFLLYLSNIGDILAKSFKWTYAKICLCRGCRMRNAPKEEEEWQMEDIEVQVPEDLQAGDENGNAAQWTNNGNGEGEGEGEGGEQDEDSETVTVPITLCLAIMVGYVCGGAVLFSEWEQWDFLDSSYFCFISLSTIGFGDMVPGDRFYASESVELSFVFCAMYLMLGMALIAMCFNLMQEEVVHKVRTCVKTIRYIFRCKRSSSSSEET